MKKFSFFAAVILFVNCANGQSLDDIKKYVLLNQPKPAKEMVDKYLAIEKNAQKPDGWYYKGYAYDITSKDSALTIPQSNALKTTAFEALKKSSLLAFLRSLLDLLSQVLFSLAHCLFPRLNNIVDDGTARA